MIQTTAAAVHVKAVTKAVLMSGTWVTPELPKPLEQDTEPHTCLRYSQGSKGAGMIRTPVVTFLRFPRRDRRSQTHGVITVMFYLSDIIPSNISMETYHFPNITALLS